MSIFRPRNIENKDSREASVEKCELKLLHPSNDAIECQLLVRLVCKHGVRKTYKLQYEQTQTMHAVTDKTICHNRFRIAAKAMKDVMDHFALRAEELSLAVNDGVLLLTSFTEGIMNEKEVLKQPIHTSISIDNREFDSMEVNEEIQITFGLREFKSVGSLCDLLGTDLSVYYSEAGKPLIVEFEKDGMVGEFVVATTADGERATHNRTAVQRNVDRCQPRTIGAGSERSAEADYAKLSEARHRSFAQQIDYAQDETQGTASRHSYTATTNGSDRSDLFVPDPDSQDSEVQRTRADLQATGEQNSTMNGDSYGDTDFGFDYQQQQALAQVYEDEEMELYADELNFESADDVIGPTQTQIHNKPRGLFD